MKKRVCKFLLSICLVFSFGLLLSACGVSQEAKVNGTYYLIALDEMDKTEYIKLENGQWQDEKGENGTYTVKDGAIVFYVDELGETIEFMSGTVGDNKLTVTISGNSVTYSIDVGDIPVSDDTKLEMPTITIDGDTVKWSKVSGAQGYNLKIDGVEQTLSSSVNSYKIEDIEATSHSVELLAVAKRTKYNSTTATKEFSFNLFAYGKGTVEEPYGIRTSAHFTNMANYANKHFVLDAINNITTFDYTNIATEFTFNGTLTAQTGAKLSNFAIPSSSLINLGENAIVDGLVIELKQNSTVYSLFNTNAGTIKNVTISGNIKAKTNKVSSILVSTNNGKINNCNYNITTTGFVTLVANNSQNGEIKNCNTSATSSLNNKPEGSADKEGVTAIQFGALCGTNNGVIEECFSTGTTVFELYYEGASAYPTSTYNNIATFVGKNNGSIVKSKSSVAVSGKIDDSYSSINISGFVGTNSSEATIANCAFVGEFSITVQKDKNKTRIGGLIADNAGEVEHCLVENIINVECFKQGYYSWGAYTNSYAGFAGSNSGAIQDCFAYGISVTNKASSSSLNQFANTINDGTTNSVFTNEDSAITLNENYWFIPYNRTPKLLVFGNYVALSGTPTLINNAGTITWLEVEDADYYEYTIDDVHYYTTNLQLTYDYSEEKLYTIYVRAGSYTKTAGEWVSVTVDVKKLTFEREDADTSLEEQVFYVPVDKTQTFTSLGISKTGYTLTGWTDGSNTYQLNDSIVVSTSATFTPIYVINQYVYKAYIYNGSFQWIEATNLTLDYQSELVTPNYTIEGLDANGYEFKGWYTNSNCTIALTFDKIPANDITIYAKYEIKKFKIIFNPNYDDVETTDINVQYNSSISHFDDAIRFGYTFLGWYLDTKGDNKVENFVMGASDVNFYAKWSLNTYNITVDADGGAYSGSIPTQYTVEDATITLPTCTRTGYTFLGWSVNNSNIYVNELPKGSYAEHLTLKAMWQVNTHTVSFDYDGGEISKDCSYTVTFDTNGTSIDLSQNQYVVNKDNPLYAPTYTATGKYVEWYKTSDCLGDKFDFNAPITENLTLYAKEVSYTIDSNTTEINGNCSYESIMNTAGSNDQYYEIVAKYPGKFAFTISGITPKNYAKSTIKVSIYVNNSRKFYNELELTVSGGSLNGQATCIFKKDFEYNLAIGDTVSIAIYETFASLYSNSTSYFNTVATKVGLRTYFVCTFEQTSVVPNWVDNFVDYDTVLGRLPETSKFGYTFNGWYLDDVRFTEDTMLKIDENITLKANFTPIVCDVNYELNGGINNSANKSQYTIEDGKWSLQNPTYDGYRFGGWYTDEELTESVNKIDYTTYPNGVTLYAKFDKLYNINFVVPDFVEQKATIQRTEQEFTQITVSPDTEDYEFGGWYLEPEFINNVICISDTASDVTLYAKYVPYYDIVAETFGGTLVGTFGRFSEISSTSITATATKKNYRFLYWCLDEELTQKISRSVGYANHNITIYAKYEHATEGLTYTYWDSLGGYEVSVEDDSNIDETDIAIMSEYNGKPVVKVSSLNLPNATSLYIPSSVQSINANALSACVKLERLTVPFAGIGKYMKGVESYDVEYIFYRLFKSIEEIPTTLKHLTVLGGELTSDTFTQKGSLAEKYNYFYSFETIRFEGEDITTIPAKAFYNQKYLKSVTFKSKITEIGEYAFYNCIDLESADFVKDVVKIGNCAFASYYTIWSDEESKDYYEGNNIKSIDLSNVQELGTYAFSYSMELSSVVLPKNITEIPDGLFNCCAFTTITIPSTVTTIGAYAFTKNSLTAVYIQSSDITIDENAFDENTSVELYYYSETAPTSSETSLWFYLDKINGETISKQIAVWNYVSDTTNPTITVGDVTYTYEGIAPETAGNYWKYDENNKVYVYTVEEVDDAE